MRDVRPTRAARAPSALRASAGADEAPCSALQERALCRAMLEAPSIRLSPPPPHTQTLPGSMGPLFSFFVIVSCWQIGSSAGLRVNGARRRARDRAGTAPVHGGHSAAGAWRRRSVPSPSPPALRTAVARSPPGIARGYRAASFGRASGAPRHGRPVVGGGSSVCCARSWIPPSCPTRTASSRGASGGPRAHLAQGLFADPRWRETAGGAPRGRPAVDDASGVHRGGPPKRYFSSSPCSEHVTPPSRGGRGHFHPSRPACPSGSEDLRRGFLLGPPMA